MGLDFITTCYQNGQPVRSREATGFLPEDGTENNVVNLYPDMTGQIIEGFGGAFTDSAGYVYAQMTQAQREELARHYFMPEGMNYTLGRIHLDSCDFSTRQYEAMSDPEDRALDSFSLAETERYILPMLRDVEQYTGRSIEVMVSPWSPPAFMKTNGIRSQGGSLKREYWDFWADYLCRYILELRKAGVSVRRMSLQNEPNAVQTWDSCIYTPEQKRDFLKQALYPALVRHGLSELEIFLWDHNKERLFERACRTIDAETDAMITGFAFHWYSGDHFEALELLRRKYPDKKLILSEACIEFRLYDGTDLLLHAKKYAHDIIGNLNAGMNAFYDWNLLLDERGGPNHVNNFCDSPYRFHTGEGTLGRQPIAEYIWHFSHFIQPGAVQVGVTRYTQTVEVVCVKNPDGTLAAVLMNPGKEPLPVVLRVEGRNAAFTLPAESISTAVITL